jgi:hypothetical protein
MLTAKSDQILGEMTNASPVGACITIGDEPFEMDAFGLTSRDELELASVRRGHVAEPAPGCNRIGCK